MKHTIAALAATALLGFACIVPATAADEDFPNRPVRLVIPFAPGGASDVLARAVAESLAQRLAQPVIAENRPGGTTAIAASYVAKSKADGYTLLFGTATHAILAAIETNLQFDAVNDFDYIGKVGQVGFVLLANPQLKANDFQGLLAMARAEPGKLQFGSAGNNSQAHLWTDAVLQQAGGRALHVPYRGEMPAFVDVMGGQLHFMICTWTACGGRVSEGRVKALAVTTRNRYASAPNIPTVAEAGVPSAEVYWWAFVAAPKGTPPPVLQKISAALNDTLKDEKFRSRLAAMGVEPETQTTSAATRALVQSDVERWRGVVAKNATSK